MIPEERSVAAADGVSIAFDVCGRGAPALVFVHGWAGRRGHWDEQQGPFAAAHRVVRVDLAGHGASGRARARWTLSHFADDVIAAVDALELESLILIGHSLGGSVIALAARRLPGRVRALIGVDTWSALGARHPAEAVEASVMLPEMRRDFASGSRRFADAMCGPTADPALRTRIADEVGSMPPQVAIAVLDEAIRQGPGTSSAHCANWTCPDTRSRRRASAPRTPRCWRRSASAAA